MKAARLSDHKNAAIRSAAATITEGADSELERLQRIFFFVRDKILFGFPPKGDQTRAEETLRLGYGQCNTKGALLVALCRAAGIEAALHFSYIEKRIQQGLFPTWAYALLPERLSHSWVDVKVGGAWRRVDSYIINSIYYEKARVALADRGWSTGYSISCASGPSSIDFSLEENGFVQMGAVISDIGRYDDPEDFYTTDAYSGPLGPFKRSIYRLMLPTVNARIRAIRADNFPLAIL